jgi:tetratricopeptide (TPR) repeat protein
MDSTVAIPIFGWLLTTALVGLVGNKANEAVNLTVKKIVERMKEGGRVVNDDIEKAVLRSYIRALRDICENCLIELKQKNTVEVSWLKKKKRELDKQLEAVGKMEYVEPPIETLDEIELLVTPQGELAQERIGAVKAQLIKIATKDCEISQCFKDNVTSDLFERMCEIFSSEIKGDQRVRNIFEGQLLARIDVEIEGQRLTIDRIEESLRDVARGILKVIPKVVEEAEHTRQHDSLEHNRTRAEVAEVGVRVQAGMDQLRQELIRQGQQGRRLKREMIVGVRPADLGDIFKDRDEELAEFRRLLGDRTVKLIILVGRGGMGKTALLAKVFDEIERGELKLNDMPAAMGADGIVYVSCRETGKLGVERLCRDVARMLGSPHAEELLDYWRNTSFSLEEKMKFLLSRMRGGCYLLVLDNLEDVLAHDNTIEDPDLKAFIDLCLTTAHGLRLVATSQEPLVTKSTGVRTSRIVQLETGLPENDCIALLRDLDPEGKLGLKGAPEDLLRTIAKKTYGFPRALETLAGLLYDDPTLDLNELLRDVSLFNAQVVSNLMTEHYRHLNDAQKLVLQGLSVFNRPTPAEAIQFLLIPLNSALDLRSVLRTLVMNHFVVQNKQRATFELHPMDQQYAYSCVPDTAQVYTKQSFHCRAADYFASRRKPASEWKTIEDIQPQLDEFGQRLRGKDYDRACELLNTISSDYLFKWGYYSLLRDLRKSLDGLICDAHLQVRNLAEIGATQFVLGEVHDSIIFFEKRRKLAEDANESEWLACALLDLAQPYLHIGEYARSFDVVEAALHIAKEIDNRKLEGDCQEFSGDLYRYLGDLPKASEFYEKALSIYSAVSMQDGVLRCLAALAVIKAEYGDIEDAIEFISKALSLAKETEDKFGEAHSLSLLSSYSLDLGDADVAIRQSEEALSICRETEMRVEEGDCLRILAEAYLSKDEHKKASELLQEALNIAELTERQDNRASILYGLGRAKHLIGELAEARRCYEEAITLNTPSTSYGCSVMLGIISAQRDDYQCAQTYFILASELCHAALDKTPGLYDAIYKLSISLLCTGHSTEAIDSYQKAIKVCSAPGVLRDELRNLQLVQQIGKPPDGLQATIRLLEDAHSRM